MDAAETRRGRECWYRFDNNGNNAVNDGVLLENGIYVILKKYFRDKPYYVQVVELFHDVSNRHLRHQSSKYTYQRLKENDLSFVMQIILKTAMGQAQDALMCKSFRETKKLDKFTMDRHKATVKYKTAYYSFQLPVSLAMLMVNSKEVVNFFYLKSYILLGYMNTHFVPSFLIYRSVYQTVESFNMVRKA